MSAFRLGVKAAVPTALGYVAIGLAFGVVAAASGLSALEVGLMCALVYGGSAQFAMCALVVAGASLGELTLTVFLVNLRNMLMSLHATTIFTKTSLWNQLGIGSLSLVGALLVGMAAAKAFAWAHGLPLIPVNHMAGHLMAAREVQELEYPLLALLVSGGHTELVYVSEPGNYKIVGETRDDAVGEAYDKVGRVMGLTYPAGREIDELAHKGKDVYDFPRAMIKEDHLEFSFSGLKSAFINLHHNAEQKGEVLVKEDLCASFQAAVLDILLAKTKKALERYPVKTLVVAGGVAANQGLRERLAEEITDVDVVIPPLRLCGDNAGMIALAAAIECDQKHFAELDLNAKPSLAFAGFEE